MKKLYRVRNEYILVYDIVHETNTRYFVGPKVVRGGYIIKGVKGDFTSFDEAKKSIRNMLLKKRGNIQIALDKINKILLPISAAADAIEDNASEEVIHEILKDTNLLKSKPEISKKKKNFWRSYRFNYRLR